jgi:hypothetical protein
MNDQEVYFDFLDALRRSGQINMFGAPPYLQEVFGLKKHEAREIVVAWMESFSERQKETV